MQNLSLVQALSLWSELERAYYQKHGFGTDTAEIYLYRLMPYEPTVARADWVGGADGMLKERATEAYQQARTSLLALLTHFATTHEADLWVNGRAPGPWLIDEPFDHRVAVTVKPRQANA
jgi:hypothetical protein